MTSQMSPLPPLKTLKKQANAFFLPEPQGSLLTLKTTSLPRLKLDETNLMIGEYA